MQTHDLIQGSPEWHQYRAQHFNASDAPAMLGVSPYKSRTQLLHEVFTGLSKEIDPATQVLFDNGHRFEALARATAEEIVGEDLYPVTGSNGTYSASFDGLTMGEDIAWEHKTLNEEIRAANSAEDLAEHLRVQMEQQLLVSSAEKCLFLASKWDNQGQLIEEKHFWYAPDAELRARITAGWEQFAIDLAAYTPAEVVQAAVATPTRDLPALSIQIDGSISLISNLDKFGAMLNAYVDNLVMQPSTDQEFADSEAAVKTLQKAQDALEAAEASALAQTASIDDMRRTVALYVDIAKKARLALQNAVKLRKEAIRVEIVMEAQDTFSAHIAHLNKRIGKNYLFMSTPDFGGAMKGLKTVTSLRNAVDTLMANAKITANDTADKIEINMNSLRELAAEYSFLFSDAGSIVLKSNDDLVNLINSRINEHKAAEAAKEEAQRARIAEEERVKAEAKARAEQAAIAAAVQKAEADFRDAEAKGIRMQAAAHAQALAELALINADDARKAAAPNPAKEMFESMGVKVVDVTATAVLNPAAAWPMPTKREPNSPPILRLGKIGERLGFSLTADFLENLGFDAAGRDRSAILYHESDFDLICVALAAHITDVRSKHRMTEAA